VLERGICNGPVSLRLLLSSCIENERL